jgi:serine protease Do
MLASAAVVAIIASGAIGGSMLSGSSSALAGAVNTADLQTSAMPSFATVVERVKPAVVAVKVNIEDVAVSSDDLSGQMDNLPPEVQQFFKRFGGMNGAPRQTQPRHEMALGSGFIISADGYIVTNNHVVQNAKTVSVTTDDGKTLDAKVIGTDPKTDLALLKITEAGDYPFVKLAKETPRIGDWVVAIGNPYGLGGTVTAGIISAEGRDIGSGPYDSFLQIDAPINKGNSGGPTFNLKGEVVGVNTAIFSPSGGSVGIGFAIPANTVDSVVDSLEHGGVVSRGYLGVQIQPVGQEIADGLGMKSTNGALIDEAQPGTPAAAAGLKSGDVIVKLNGQEVKDASDLTRHIGSMKPGDNVELSFLRDGAEKTVSITLGSMKSEQTAKADVAPASDSALKLGVQLAPASGEGQGVAIVNVDPDGLAASKGLASGDVIMEVAGKPVSSASEVKADIAKAKQDGRKSVLMLVKTAQASRFVAFEFPKA